MKQPVFKKIIAHTNVMEAPLPDFKKAKINTSGKNKPSYIIPIYGGYDVETTTTDTFDGPRAAVYSHAVTLANMQECHVYLMRKWEDYLAFLDRVREYYGLNEYNRLIIWVANLSFEFSFIQRRLTWDRIFAKEMYNPLLASSGGLEFRECLTISGGSLETLAKDYCYTQKLKGDLDYRKLRNTDTVLTDQELQYIINDVVILAEYSKYLFKTIIRPKRYVPMTRTGILNREVHDTFHDMAKAYGAGAEKVYTEYVQKCFPDEKTYFQWFSYLFRGGYVHANALYSNIDLNGQDGIKKARMKDITSSYPATMLKGYVPRGPFKDAEWDPDLLKSKCCIIYAKFYNIRIITHHSIESKNKIINYSGATWDNGRMIKADYIEVCLTELDYDIYEHFMEWDTMEVYRFQIADRGTLPSFLLSNLIEAYAKKTELKLSGKNNTPEYAVQKSAVNTFYGLQVKRIRVKSIEWTSEGGWNTKDNDGAFERERKKALMLPASGIWITAGSRHDLLMQTWRLIHAGVQVYYMDTDSIKYGENPKAEKIFKKYNAYVRKRIRNRGYTDPVFAGLGEFDDETHGKAVRMKTLGAKRYIYTDPEKGVKATVAGMPKSSVKMLGETEDDIYDEFSTSGFSLDMEDSGKLRPVYAEEPYDIYINGEWMHEESGCALVGVPFSMHLKDDYIDLIGKMQDIERIGGAI